MITALKKHPTLLGAFYVFLGVFIFSAVNIIVKDTASHYPIIQVLFIRFLTALLPLLFLMRKNLTFEGLCSQKPKLQLSCAFMISIGVGCLFLSVQKMPLADAQAISFSSTLFLTALAHPLIGEKVGIRRWISVIIGFIGVLIVINPSATIINVGGLYGLVFSILQAIVLLYSRILLKYDSPILTSFYICIVSCILCAPFLPFVWISPPLDHFLLLIVMGLGGGTAQLLILSGYKHAEATVVSPILYTALVWGMLFDFIVWQHLPNSTMLIGAVIIISSSLYILLREHKKIHQPA